MNSVMEFFTDGKREYAVVFTPDDQSRMCDTAEVWGEIGFPEGERVSYGHNGFNDAWSSTVVVGSFHDVWREERLVVDDLLEDRLGDHPAE